MKKYTLGPPNYENHLPRSASEDPDDPQETPRPPQGRQKEPQRRFQELSGRPLGFHLSSLEVLFRWKSMIWRHFWAKIMSQRWRKMKNPKKTSILKHHWKTLFFLRFFKVFWCSDENIFWFVERKLKEINNKQWFFIFFGKKQRSDWKGSRKWVPRWFRSRPKATQRLPEGVR